MTTDTLRIEHLPNGLVHVRDLASGLTAAYNPDGSYQHGPLHPSDPGGRTILSAVRAFLGFSPVPMAPSGWDFID
jgi:hypothetical protein